MSGYGYEYVDEFKKVVEKNLEKKVPLEVIHADNNYMQKYDDFSISYVKTLSSVNLSRGFNILGIKTAFHEDRKNLKFKRIFVHSRALIHFISATINKIFA